MVVCSFSINLDLKLGNIQLQFGRPTTTPSPTLSPISLPPPLSRYRARCDRHGPAISVAPPPLSSPHRRPWCFETLHSIPDFHHPEFPFVVFTSNSTLDVTLIFQHQCLQHCLERLLVSSARVGKGRQASDLPHLTTMLL